VSQVSIDVLLPPFVEIHTRAPPGPGAGNTPNIAITAQMKLGASNGLVNGSKNTEVRLKFSPFADY